MWLCIFSRQYFQLGKYNTLFSLVRAPVWVPADSRVQVTVWLSFLCANATCISAVWRVTDIKCQLNYTTSLSKLSTYVIGRNPVIGWFAIAANHWTVLAGVWCRKMFSETQYLFDTTMLSNGEGFRVNLTIIGDGSEERAPQTLCVFNKRYFGWR